VRAERRLDELDPRGFRHLPRLSPNGLRPRPGRRARASYHGRGGQGYSGGKFTSRVTDFHSSMDSKRPASFSR
jgi:hypothetical protein